MTHYYYLYYLFICFRPTLCHQLQYRETPTFYLFVLDLRYAISYNIGNPHIFYLIFTVLNVLPKYCYTTQYKTPLTYLGVWFYDN